MDRLKPAASPVFEHQQIREAVRHRLRSVLAAGMTPDEAAEAVLRLLTIVEEITDVETTTLGDAFEQHTWVRFAVCRLGLDTGTYQGGPVGG